ncbi:UPF0210 protein [Auxenochlorella protothecoides]|uniref:UPF0210 protein n=2 Tax=Auxenochlorella protothecoides TaxID=3075 RepID=A0A087SE58_AUXPR|nr:UPF0210 protein [Auxenochlorella protothecoides]KFM24012.1 UPF0210 protein [Auxenochlorella protothecoides]RMZ52869.1 hypothetical protein APUTEX25_000988 [Auxenochlorella protothecoides]|eukprot:RMZ52869.1 hypothetical protein APUTEX25_000988 [Auxenochlorella protothecoides]
MASDITTYPCIVRSVTYFVPEGDVGSAGWEGAMQEAAAFLATARGSLEQEGITVQTLRVATDILTRVESVEEALRKARVVQAAAAASGISFVSYGAFSNARLLEEGLATKLLTTPGGDAYTCCTFRWQPGMGVEEARSAARAIFSLGRATGDAGPFHFALTFAEEGFQTPFFPAACATRPGFAIATENSAQYAAALASAGEGGPAGVTPALRAAMAAGLRGAQACAVKLATATHVPYLGIDTSINPGLEGPSLAGAFESVGLGPFGGPGTLAVAERVTAAVQSLSGIDTTGYCGLMLPLAEDTGLAAASRALSVQTLLFYSAVCGCGLDTVPVPGVSDETPAGEAARLVAAAAALVLDIAGMAARLGKPLTCRLLPVAGGKAGQATAWDSPYLVPGTLLSL